MLFGLSVWFKRKGHFAGEIQPQPWQGDEIQNTKAHITNYHVSHSTPSIPHLQKYYGQTHDTGGSVVEVSALDLPRVCNTLGTTGQIILVKPKKLLSLSLHHYIYVYTQSAIQFGVILNFPCEYEMGRYWT